MIKAPNYNKTDGLVDLINRKAIWGQVRGRVVGIILIEDKGAVAEFIALNSYKVHFIPVEKLRLVPLELLPKEDRNGNSSQQAQRNQDGEGSDCAQEIISRHS